MSDLGTKKAHKKFREGQAVSGRVLAVDPAARRLTLTLKPALLGSKLPAITCLQVGAREWRAAGAGAAAAWVVGRAERRLAGQAWPAATFACKELGA